MSAPTSYLAPLGVFGFEPVEPVILAALVTEDPLLLIGASGTGKTFLLNSLSEALGLEHRHYNASLIAFDDLVGFPYPEVGKDGDKGGVRFLETPATVWQAESVLIDEVSRCKPEHQNRLFSLVHERRVQGIALPRLRYRWAAMNPCNADQTGLESYAGSEPLDPALADRFSLFVRAADWTALPDADRRAIADPGGEGRIADDGGRLREAVAGWRATFLARLEDCPAVILDYATIAVSALNQAQIRISPRRARLMARSLLALTIVTGTRDEAHFRSLLEASLPHPCWGVEPAREVVSAAHRLAWDSAVDTARRWLHAFMAEASLAGKLAHLIDGCTTPDEGSQAVAQLIASESPARAAAFAYAIYPLAAQSKLPIGAEGANDLGRIAARLYMVDGEIRWQERNGTSGTRSPALVQCLAALKGLENARAERARQFFDGCLVHSIPLEDARALEAEIDACVTLLKARGLA